MKKAAGFAIIILTVLCVVIWKKEAMEGLIKKATREYDEPATGQVKNTVYHDVVYGQNIDWQGEMQNLTMDVYLPVTAPAKNKFPLIIYVHGGGFMVGDKKDSKVDCEILNTHGFIVATINYRLGKNDRGEPCLSNEPETFLSIYRTVQDLGAAARYLTANADKYGIDTNWIFFEGASAGACICLETAFLNQDSATRYFNPDGKNLGLISNAGNNLTNKYSIKGIGSMWGALYSPYIITKQNAVPTIFFHGVLDNVLPWNIGHFYSCDNLSTDYGTKPMYERLTSLGVPAVAHIDPSGKHGVYDKQFCEDNIACFFKSIMNGKPQTGWYTTPVSSCK